MNAWIPRDTKKKIIFKKMKHVEVPLFPFVLPFSTQAPDFSSDFFGCDFLGFDQSWNAQESLPTTLNAPQSMYNCNMVESPINADTQNYHPSKEVAVNRADEEEVFEITNVTHIVRKRGRPRKNPEAPNGVLMLTNGESNLESAMRAPPAPPVARKPNHAGTSKHAPGASVINQTAQQVCRMCTSKTAHQYMIEWEFTVNHFTQMCESKYIQIGEWIYIDLPTDLAAFVFDVAVIVYNLDMGVYMLYSLTHMCYYANPWAWMNQTIEKNSVIVSPEISDRLRQICSDSVYHYMRSQHGFTLRDVTTAMWERFFAHTASHMCVATNWNAISIKLLEKTKEVTDAQRNALAQQHSSVKTGEIMLKVQTKAAADTQVVIANLVRMLADKERELQRMLIFNK